MKFTRGYWITRENFIMNYARQWIRTEREDNALRVLSACHPINGRGDILNGANMEITFSAPRDNNIRVTLTQWHGRKGRLPR